MTREDLSDIANMFLEINGALIASRQSGPSYNLNGAIDEAVDRAWWQIEMRQPEDPLAGL